MKRLLERAVRRLRQDEGKLVAAVGTTPSDTGTVATPPSAPSVVTGSGMIGDGAAFDPAGRRESVIHALRKQVAEGSGGRFGADQVHSDAPLFDRGYLDSFSYVELLVFIEQTYKVRIHDSRLAGDLRTIAAMADYILREEAQAS